MEVDSEQTCRDCPPNDKQQQQQPPSSSSPPLASGSSRVKPCKPRRCRDPKDVSPKVDKKKKGQKQRGANGDDIDGKVSPDQDVGCFDLLKKISCTLSCGGTTCSIKETDPDCSLSSSAESSASSSPKLGASRSRSVRQCRTRRLLPATYCHSNVAAANDDDADAGSVTSRKRKAVSLCPPKGERAKQTSRKKKKEPEPGLVAGSQLN